MLQLSGIAIVGLSGLHAKEKIKVKNSYDIVILGGGPAGLSAALTAARGNRSILVIDSGQARNAPADHMMNFPSREGIPPLDFRNMIKKDLVKYPHIHFRDGRVESIVKTDDGFLVDQVHAKKVLLAHGVKDILPPIEGLKELFGKSIFHCPYCHGYEHSGAPMGVVASAQFAPHLGHLVKGLTNDVVIFTDGGDLASFPGAKVYNHKIEAFLKVRTKLVGVKLSNGEVIKRDYLFMKFEQKLSSELGIKLGCEITEHGHYKINEMGETTVPGIFAAGDCASPKQSVLMACASGQMAGAAMNAKILMEGSHS